MPQELEKRADTKVIAVPTQILEHTDMVPRVRRRGNGTTPLQPATILRLRNSKSGLTPRLLQRLPSLENMLTWLLGSDGEETEERHHGRQQSRASGT